MPRPWIPRLQLPPELWDKPQVRQIATATGLDRWGVVGRLTLLWSHAQSKATKAGVLEGKGVEWVNWLVECAGFAEAMILAGWLACDGGSVRIPNFDEFVSKVAIRRAEKTDWMRDQRTAATATDGQPWTLCGPNVDATWTERPPPPASPAPAPVPPVAPPPAQPAPLTPAQKGAATKAAKAGKPMTAAFLEFWDLYPASPNKTGKAEAWVKWQGINPDAALVGRMLDALRRSSASEQWIKDDGQYIPNPNRWLKERRWEAAAEGGGPVPGSSRVKPSPGQFDSRRDLSKGQGGADEHHPPGGGASLF